MKRPTELTRQETAILKLLDLLSQHMGGQVDSDVFEAVGEIMDEYANAHVIDALQSQRDRIARNLSPYMQESWSGPTTIPVITVMNILSNPTEYP